ncbi:fungal-specific transcription factor domain-containing protein [Ilyonectria robusta]|uniref:fungal-specific transcription factor domain-containing protein n=1 Tax=Ilyonectria robusta TaxID=1079257 RepID=UPI001E8DCF02|nr:fungal-specific transcription factor domain-containing protein [Ilyonectria robusta]KAH8650476.1 fungal-specific transcription factor domain-containing protein [Ilyonectria robusta]
MASKVAQATISFGVPSSGSYLQSKISTTLFLRPSCPPLAVSAAAQNPGPETDSLEEGNSDAGGQHPPQSERPYTSNLIDLKSIPYWALERMVRNYAGTHLPQYPCISEAMLQSIVERTQNEGLEDSAEPSVYGPSVDSGLGPFEYFILFIVLAISALTMTWKDEQQARTTSESFYKSALKHLQVLEDPSEIKALQISLLLAHFAHMCPERVDNWTCIANAIRIVLALGLHREFPQGMDPEQARLRSELFWVAYGMERSLCANLRLPLSFPEEAITTKLKDPSPDESNASFTTDDIRKKSSANHICRYRSLETEVHRVLYLKEDLALNGVPIGDWITDITGQLEGWYAEAQTYTQYNMLEFKHVQFYHLRLRIHRPTPTLSIRHPDDWANSGGCQRLIEDYLSQERRRRLFYPWHGTHILFETALVALDASWSARDYQPLREQAERMVQTLIPQCLQILTNIGQRWSEATRCANKLRPMVEKVSSAFAWAAQVSVFEAVAIADEIETLLFSDKSLSWNRAAMGDINFGFEDGNLFFDNLLVDDLETFQWAPEWDLLSGEML